MSHRLLSIDGGGVRGVVALEVLARIERLLRDETGDPDLVLGLVRRRRRHQRDSPCLRGGRAWHWGSRGAAVVRATAREGSTAMPEEPEDDEGPLTHDLPCVRCGHAAHP